MGRWGRQKPPMGNLGGKCEFVGEFGAAFTCSTALCKIYRHPFLPDGGSLKLRDQSVKWITVPHLPPWVASVCVTHLSN